MQKPEISDVMIHDLRSIDQSYKVNFGRLCLTKNYILDQLHLQIPDAFPLVYLMHYHINPYGNEIEQLIIELFYEI